ncbi:MAG: GAF domain-containing protein [Lentisphaeraceae bacterium]|nr:GAF domain-containing protein [Lentisphaeraceae bacterium]
MNSGNRNRPNPNDEKMSPMAGRLMLVLGYMKEFQGALDIKDLYASAIDAVLSVTGMDRGYGFVIEYKQEQMSLKEITSRKKGSDFFEQDYTISKSMLKKVIKANGAVIIDDADSSTESTVSMRDFKIKSVVCLPLILHDKDTQKDVLRGIIYADKMMTGKLQDHIRTTLQMLTELIAINIDRCLKYQDMNSTVDTYNEFLKMTGERLSDVSDNLGVISEAVEKDNPDDHQTLLGHTVDQGNELGSIIENLTN